MGLRQLFLCSSCLVSNFGITLNLEKFNYSAPLPMLQLTDQEALLLTKIFRKYFLNAYKMIFMLDQKQADNFKQRNAYYYEQLHKHKHGHKHEEGKQCCGSFFSKIYIPEKERTGLEQLVSDAFRPFALRESLPKVLDYLAQRFNNIKKSGQKDKMVWDTEAEVYVLNEVLKEGLQAFYGKEIRALMQHEQFVDSRQQMLVATPQTWKTNHPKIPLEFLDGPFIEGLMKRGFAVMGAFTKNKDFARALFKELDFLEKDGRLEEHLQEQSLRQDKSMWLTLSQIEKAHFPQVHHIAFTLSALPYELNTKTQILAQISETFQISYFHEKRRLHKMHMDSSLEKQFDTGKKVSILYFVLQDENSMNKIRINDQEIVASMDMMIGLQSRKVPYEIEGDGSKMFVIRYWIDGPYDGRNDF